MYTGMRSCKARLAGGYGLGRQGGPPAGINARLSAREKRRYRQQYGARQHLAHDARKVESQADSESRAVNIAIGSNVFIFAAKVFVSSNSGSSALFAEAVHTLADIGNQLLLRFGIARSKQAPTEEYPCAPMLLRHHQPSSSGLTASSNLQTCDAFHPEPPRYKHSCCRYGYMKEKFIFSLISAVGVFCIGAGASVINGAYALADLGTTHSLPNSSLQDSSFNVVSKAKPHRTADFVGCFTSCFVSMRDPPSHSAACRS